MTYSTKRLPRPMPRSEIVYYRELKANLIVQAELIMSIFHPLNSREYITEVKFEIGHPQGPHIQIYYEGYNYGEDYRDFILCPENYLSMTEDELKAEKARLVEEEKRKKAEKAAQRVAKAKATREKHKAEREKRKAKKTKDERYKKYLELKKEFEERTAE